jgi:hypothetical protein
LPTLHLLPLLHHEYALAGGLLIDCDVLLGDEAWKLAQRADCGSRPRD